ncbi:MAG: GNAT family N-acetyltransferase [Pyrinomonadaceae bacterium]|nr:GNAT family N-acetyltransferase [Blastocatellia bacterium]MCW5955818.1 GNAT family N-acetyltransferase [Pyrinomonadaceae bacterium]
MTMIKVAETDEEIDKCYPVMAELRPHVAREDFLHQVRRQMAASGFQLVYLSVGSDIKAVAGIRIAEWLARGKSLDLEDLVSAESDRSKGFGGKLFDWIVDLARKEDCTEVRLVSHVTRYRAHRFYLNKRMRLDAHFFSMSLNSKE